MELFRMARGVAVLCLLFSLCFSSSMGDLQADQKECQTQLTSLASCFQYVQGKDKSPSHECCTNLDNVKNSKPKCLCILIKDSTTPALGFSINTTLALQMPSVCKVDANTKLCPGLLNISPSSPDAKIFGVSSNSTSPAHSGAETTSTPASGSTSNLRALVDAKTRQGLWRTATLVVTVASVYLSVFY